MKFYATVTCRRLIEIDTENYESALAAADQQVTALLPEREQWKPEIEVSAVRGMSDDRYYVHRQSPRGCLVRERQLEYQAGPDKPGTHPTDPIIRLFDERDDAHQYARSMNEAQRKLDKRYGLWVQHAVLSQDTGSEGVPL